VRNEEPEMMCQEMAVA